MKEDFLSIVYDLNAELYDQHNDELNVFSYSTNGYEDRILFNGVMLWNSEIDEREFIEESNEYEPLLPHVKKLFNEYADMVYKLKFK